MTGDMDIALTPLPIEQENVSSDDTVAAEFGTTFGRFMTQCDCVNGEWSRPTATPLAPLSLHPGTHALHYASQGFEGMKAYRQPNGRVKIFRLDDHVRRFQGTARGLHLPVPPANIVRELIVTAVRKNQDAVPDVPSTLYLRPTIIGTEANIGAVTRPSRSALVFVIVSPMERYFSSNKRLRLLIEDKERAVLGIGGSNMGVGAERDWREIASYGRDPNKNFIPIHSSTFYVNRTINGERSLYKSDANGKLTLLDLQGPPNSGVTFFGFSNKLRKAIFSSESLDRAPELFIWDQDAGSRQITDMNAEINSRISYTATKVAWESFDGTEVSGWLIEPNSRRFGRKPWPVVTFLHGGPGLAMSNEFAGYFKAWPYPHEVYATEGIAVFYPNYRGTRTFGRDFADPEKTDGEPIDDIISGIETLVDSGVADSDKLGISGQSHGALIGPLVMSKMDSFVVGSFAEGVSGFPAMYSTMTGILNSQVHDVLIGKYYQDPDRYLELSPELHFNGLKTATLFEGGALGLGMHMLGLPKAARDAGMPTEFVVYPQTRHNITDYRLQEESAGRNLDWFLFWLKGEEDPSPEKAEQYNRWRAMRDESCTREDLETPSYCAVH